MRKAEVFPYYRSCSEKFNAIYEFIKTQFDDDYADELCKLRGYVSEEQYNLVHDMKLGCCSVFGSDLGDSAKELGCLTKTDDFLLNDRYIIPVEDVGGNICALIGYYPDYKRYITTPSPFFSKECMFFNFRQAYELSWSKFNGFVIVVEGIFDCLSVRSLGLPCIACMGASLSKSKGELLKLFKKVAGIPDNDATGRKSLNRYSRQGWKVPSNTTMIKLIGGTVELDGETLHVKDLDNLVSWYDADDVREILLSLQSCKSEIEELIL